MYYFSIQGDTAEHKNKTGSIDSAHVPAVYRTKLAYPSIAGMYKLNIVGLETNAQQLHDVDIADLFEDVTVMVERYEEGGGLMWSFYFQKSAGSSLSSPLQGRPSRMHASFLDVVGSTLPVGGQMQVKGVSFSYLGDMDKLYTIHMDANYTMSQGAPPMIWIRLVANSGEQYQMEATNFNLVGALVRTG